MAGTIKKTKLVETISYQSIFLRLLTQDDVSEKYIRWLKDAEVNQYLADTKRNATIKGLRRYVQQLFKSPYNYLFGIYIQKTQEHIGNIKIGNIDPKHLFADIGLLIGEKKHRGKRYGTFAIIAATNFSFSRLNLNKLYATMTGLNIASYKAFTNAGFEHAGTLHRHRKIGNSFTDIIFVEKLNN